MLMVFKLVSRFRKDCVLNNRNVRVKVYLVF